MSSFQLDTWVEPFSEREIEILGHISDGRANRNIADNLHLSLETVKWYNKQIFSKLGVSNRTQAAKKAQELKLLEMQFLAPLEEGFPPPNNLNAQLSSYVGRSQETIEIKKLLASNRLVTLTGPGGSGKTRLALHVAGELLNNYRDGVWQVELAAVNHPDNVLNVLAGLFNVNVNRKESLISSLIRFLRKQQLMILFDNFEHLLEAAPLVGEILDAAPQVTILATSRERLNLYGEQEFPVSPLALPDLDQRQSPEKLLAFDAINLFVQRARATLPSFSIDDVQINAVAQICVRLDGLPLAIELAASQVKVYPPAILAQRLEDDLGILASGPRNLPARQQTLTATIQWSYELLDQDQKLIFDRLAVFKGGGTIEAIAEICGSDLSGDITDILFALVNKNLVTTRENRYGEIKFGMLETIREYSIRRFAENQSVERIYQKHAAYFTGKAEEIKLQFRQGNQVYWSDWMHEEHENLRAVLAWSLEGDDPTYGIRLISAMNSHWGYNGFVVEGYRWAEIALTKVDQAAPELRGRVLQGAGVLAWLFGDFAYSLKLSKEALKFFQQAGEKEREAGVLVLVGLIEGEENGEIEKGIALIQRALDHYRQAKDKFGKAHALNALGELARMNGDYPAAKQYYKECLAQMKGTGNQIRGAITRINLGIVATHNKEYQSAVDLIQEGLTLHKNVGSDYGMFCHVAFLAGPTAALGFPKRAARFLGASHAHTELIGIGHDSADAAEIKKYYDAIQRDLGENDFEEAYQEGYKMSLKEVMTYALDGSEIGG